MCGGDNGTNGCRLAVFTVDVAFACHFMATHPHPLPHPIAVLVVLAILVKNLKWCAIQLAIHSLVGEEMDYKYLNIESSICFPS